MQSSFNLILTGDLLEFVEQNAGPGTQYVTPNDFVCHVLREKMEKQEASRICDSIVHGYQDALRGRTIPYRGDLRELLNQSDG